ncbi:MAG: hypothetical protein FJ298_03380 [Planctomycetes bacterium]|nr:hypothetical protein [Planctomycetota bacterium]
MHLLASLSIPVLLLALPAAAQSGSITGLGPALVRASGISADGNAIAGYASNQAHYWTTSSPAWQSTGDGRGSDAKISNAAAFLSADIYDPNNANRTTAARWEAATGLWTPLPGLGGVSGSSVSTAYDLSGDGRTVVGLAWKTAGEAHAFMWTPSGSTVDIGLWLPGPGWSSRANAVSSNGNFAAGLGTSPQRAIRWNLTAGTGQYLGSLDPNNATTGPSTAYGISADGTWVVGTSVYNAFRWSAATGMQSLGALGTAGMGNAGYATAVSADGKVVVGWSGANVLNSQAVIWREGMASVEKLQDYLLNNGVPTAYSQWQVLKIATEISADGRFVVGWGANINNQTEGFRIELPVFQPQAYCTGKTNSQGCTPTVAFTGYASASLNQPFQINCNNVLNDKSGLLFYGFGQSAAPFQGGFLCVQPPTARTAVQLSGGPSGAPSCLGSYGFDFNAYIRSGVDTRLVAGLGCAAQFWMRDPASTPTTGLSNAVGFVINP